MCDSEEEEVEVLRVFLILLLKYAWAPNMGAAGQDLLGMAVIRFSEKA